MRRLSSRTRAVLSVIVKAPHDMPPWGLTICRITGLGTGTVYPLERLRRAGLIRAHVEDPPPIGQPPRKFYRATLRGQSAAEAQQA